LLVVRVVAHLFSVAAAVEVLVVIVAFLGKNYLLISHTQLPLAVVVQVLV
jgi:hypothetical protein